MFIEFQALLEFVTDKQGEVRQAAAFGCGVLGQFAGPAFAPVCAQAIPLLVQVIQNPDARNEVNLNPTENAIAAVTKILKYNSSAVNVDEVSLQFLEISISTTIFPHLFVHSSISVFCFALSVSVATITATQTYPFYWSASLITRITFLYNLVNYMIYSVHICLCLQKLLCLS